MSFSMETTYRRIIDLGIENSQQLFKECMC